MEWVHLDAGIVWMVTKKQPLNQGLFLGIG
jgi:hypothetical protein